MSERSDTSRAPRHRKRRLRSRVRSLAAVVFVIAVVLVVGPLLGRSTQQLGPGSVEITFKPALKGQTTLALPPIGQASAQTHPGPVELELELKSIDVSRLLKDDGRVNAADLRASIETDLQGALVNAALRLMAVAALLGAMAAAALPRRRWLSIMYGGVGGAVIAGLMAALTLPGFDAAKFEDLTYRGPITTGGQVLATLSSSGSVVGDRVDALADKLAGLYSATLTDEIVGSADDVVILHISDLHLNPVGAQLSRRLATSFEVDAVVDTGDTTSFGSDFEGLYADLLSDFPVPYLFVGGNHDSRANRLAISRTPGVESIHNRTVDIRGLRIAGFDDPLITTTEDVPREQRERVELDATPQLQALLDRDQPDVLAIHNPVILQNVVGSVPLAIGGHQHETKFGARDGTLISLVGSTGATGLGSLLADSEVPASASLLRFRAGRLVTVDELTVVGVNGDLVIKRHTITDVDREGDNADFIGRDVNEATLAKDAETTTSSTSSSTSTSSIAPTTTAAGR